MCGHLVTLQVRYRNQNNVVRVGKTSAVAHTHADGNRQYKNIHHNYYESVGLLFIIDQDAKGINEVSTFLNTQQGYIFQ